MFMQNYKIKDLPEQDRPREKMLKYGAACLTNAELLAILLRTGTKEKSVLSLAGELIKSSGEQLSVLAKNDIESLSKVKGIGVAKAITIIAALELGRRVDSATIVESSTISSPHDAAKVFRSYLRDEKKEQFYVMLLNIKNKLISVERLSIGTLNAAMAEPRDVFHMALLKNAAALLLAHNHPSGDPTPSVEDKRVTDRIMLVGENLGIPVLDHIIIGLDSYYSFKNNSLKKII